MYAITHLNTHYTAELRHQIADRLWLPFPCRIYPKKRGPGSRCTWVSNQRPTSRSTRRSSSSLPVQPLDGCLWSFPPLNFRCAHFSPYVPRSPRGACLRFLFSYFEVGYPQHEVVGISNEWMAGREFPRCKFFNFFWRSPPTMQRTVPSTRRVPQPQNPSALNSYPPTTTHPGTRSFIAPTFSLRSTSKWPKESHERPIN